MANAYKNKVVYNGNTLIDLSDTTAVAADVNSGKYVYLADGSRVQGSQTVHTVSETLTHVTSTNQASKVISGSSFHAVLTPDSGYRIESITVTMGGADITSQVFSPGTGAKAITANGTYDASDDLLGGYSQVTVNVPGGGGSVSITSEANATGTTCVITTSAGPEPAITWETIFDGQASLVTDGNDIYFWISSLSDVYPVAGEKWRITFEGSEYIVIATYESDITLPCVGNPAYDGYGGQDDGSGCPVCFFNAGWGAWTGGAAPSYGVGTYQLKLEREVSA